MIDSCRRSEGGRSGGGGGVDESNTALNQTEESCSEIETYVNNLIMQSGMT